MEESKKAGIVTIYDPNPNYETDYKITRYRKL